MQITAGMEEGDAGEEEGKKWWDDQEYIYKFIIIYFYLIYNEIKLYLIK